MSSSCALEISAQHGVGGALNMGFVGCLGHSTAAGAAGTLLTGSLVFLQLVSGLQKGKGR